MVLLQRAAITFRALRQPLMPRAPAFKPQPNRLGITFRAIAEILLFRLLGMTVGAGLGLCETGPYRKPEGQKSMTVNHRRTLDRG